MAWSQAWIATSPLELSQSCLASASTAPDDPASRSERTAKYTLNMSARALPCVGRVDQPAQANATLRDCELYPLSGKFSLMCNSRSCLGVTSLGAPINRSTACWFIG